MAIAGNYDALRRCSHGCHGHRDIRCGHVRRHADDVAVAAMHIVLFIFTLNSITIYHSFFFRRRYLGCLGCRNTHPTLPLLLVVLLFWPSSFVLIWNDEYCFLTAIVMAMGGLISHQHA
jgi:hypothetical protein